MFLKLNKIKMNQATDTNNGGGDAGKQTQQNQSQGAQSKEGAEQTGNPIEDRYKKTAPQQQQSSEQQPDKTDDKKDEKATEENSASGYGDELEDVEAGGYSTKDEKKAEEKKGDESQQEVELNLEGLAEEDAKDLKEFVSKNKLPKEAAQALVEREKTMIAAMTDAVDKVTKEFKGKLDTERRERKQKWQQELKTDKDFSGEKGELFKPNLKKVDLVLEKFFPNVLKDLTKNKGSLPPSAMRDILKMHESFFKNDKFVQGEMSQSADDNMSAIEKRYSKSKN